MTHVSGSLSLLRERYGERYRWLLLLSVMVGTMASIMSSTIVNVAIPDMSHYFTLGQERAQWVTSGFMVATTVSMLTTPWLLSRYGYRATVPCGAMLLLLAGGVGGGLARDFGLVLAARVAEGLALQAWCNLSRRHHPLRIPAPRAGLRQRHFGMGWCWPRPGPQHWRPAGGLVWLASIFSWWCRCARHRSGWPISLCAASAPGGVEPNRQGEALDWRGLLLGTVGTLCLLNGLVSLHGGSMAEAATPARHRSGLCGRFHRLATPTHPTRPQTFDGLAAVPVSTICHGVWWPSSTALPCSVLTYLLPVYMQLGLELSASHVGTLMLPAGFVLAVTIALVGRLADRQPTHFLVSIGFGAAGAVFRPHGVCQPGLFTMDAGGLCHPWAHRSGLHPAIAQFGSHASAGQIADFPRVERHRFLCACSVVRLGSACAASFWNGA